MIYSLRASKGIFIFLVLLVVATCSVCSVKYEKFINSSPLDIACYSNSADAHIKPYGYDLVAPTLKSNQAHYRGVFAAAANFNSPNSQNEFPSFFKLLIMLSALFFGLACVLIFLILSKNKRSRERFNKEIAKGEEFLEPPCIESLQGKEGAEYAVSFVEAVEKTVETLKQKALDNNKLFEEALLKRTEDLNAEIADLQRKLKDEYTKNTKKDQMMIRQSRLAAMGEMISNIAHQWRQPLNALALTIQDIEDSYHHNEITDTYIHETVEKSMELIQHMSVTIDDFRNFYKTNKDMVDFSLKRSVDEAMKIISASLKNFSIDTEINCVNDINVRGYPNEFSQVILNLLSNSKDALLDNRSSDRLIKIFIDQSETGKGRLTIIDNGGGIPSEILENVFDPYFSTKEQGRGTGIGLYMSKTIIENNMGGKIDIANIDDGTRVILEL